ncbi:uncharacterized protein LOC144101775 [Amblyomma americanum]
MAHSEVETLPEVLEQPDVMPGSQENTPQKTEAAAVVQEREDIFVENADRHAEVVAQLLDTFHLAAHWDAGVGQQFIDVGCGPGNLTLHPCSETTGRTNGTLPGIFHRPLKVTSAEKPWQMLRRQLARQLPLLRTATGRERRGGLGRGCHHSPKTISRSFCDRRDLQSSRSRLIK